MISVSVCLFVFASTLMSPLPYDFSLIDLTTALSTGACSYYG